MAQESFEATGSKMVVINDKEIAAASPGDGQPAVAPLQCPRPGHRPVRGGGQRSLRSTDAFHARDFPHLSDSCSTSWAACAGGFSAEERMDFC